MIKKLFMLSFAAFFATSPVMAEPQETSTLQTSSAPSNQADDYLTALGTLKSSPENTINKLKQMTDYPPALMEYLILFNIYHPEQVNNVEYAKYSEKMHNLIVAQYEDLSKQDSIYKMYLQKYYDYVGDDFMPCYREQKCLLELGAFEFQTFFEIWNYQNFYSNSVPQAIKIPCKVAQKYDLVAVIDEAGGGQGAETFDLSDCDTYSKYDLPIEVEQYLDFVRRNWTYYNNEGSIRFLNFALEKADDLNNRYAPQFSDEDVSYPLEKWSLESYANLHEYERVTKSGIGLEQAINAMTEHYKNLFGVTERQARNQAIKLFRPNGTNTGFADKNSLRYQIAHNASLEQITSYMKDHIQRGSDFGDEQYSDTILMFAVGRPDVLKNILKLCSGQSGCKGLKINVNAKNAFGKTALMYAAQYNFLESAKILLDAGADINAQTDGPTMQPQEDTCSSEYCIKNGQRTALMYAAQEGNLQMVKLLVERGASIYVLDSTGASAHDYLIGRAPLSGVLPINVTGETKRYPNMAADTAPSSIVHRGEIENLLMGNNKNQGKN